MAYGRGIAAAWAGWRASACTSAPAGPCRAAGSCRRFSVEAATWGRGSSRSPVAANNAARMPDFHDALARLPLRQRRLPLHRLGTPPMGVVLSGRRGRRLGAVMRDLLVLFGV